MNDKDRITAVLVTILESAIAGGLSESDAEWFYDSIIESYDHLDDRFPPKLIKTIGKIVKGAK